MSLLSVTENWADGSTLTAAQLAAAMTSIETWANGNIDSSNIAAGGITEACLATGSVSAAKLAADAVTTAKIADSNVTTAKIADSNVTTAKIADSNVTTAKIAANAVTRAKIEAVGQQISSSSGTFSTTSSTFTDVTNLSVSITTTGRMVFVGLIHDGSGNVGELGSTVEIANFQLLRGATSLGEVQVPTGLPLSALNTYDTPAAGTYTYKLQARKISSAARVFYAKLIAFEL